MAEVHFTDDALTKAKGKVIVLTGGAQGIGGSFVKIAYTAGAHLFVGDWDVEKGEALAASLRADKEASANGGTVTFQRVDVTNYKSQLALFEAAVAAHGHIDTAVPFAAGGEPRGFFEPETLTIESLQAEPTAIRDRLELNVLSVVYFCRIALAYMRNPDPDAAQRAYDAKEPMPKSIVLIASLAGIAQNPGVPIYITSKHAVMGLLRSFAPYAPVRYNVRINAMCPSATNTRMIDSLTESWVAAGLPMNQPEDVARYVLLCATDEQRNGNAIYISGGKGVDIEDGYVKTMPVWMGLQHTIDLQASREFCGLGDGWVETKTSWQEKKE
ncbi:hypothetical protein SEUCBS139899_004948 [Sporothrix eucalyptigena]|uniref:Uncharacterized protein n=1 Tax=Sporothrix eucalyptigena TaxID=1812306 RepID=A0ABP0AMB8_9PEZI